jgi:hypothetical protein
MANKNINREILAVFMESPFYFTIPLKRRLEFLRFFSQTSVYHRICEYNEHLISGKSGSKPRIK